MKNKPQDPEAHRERVYVTKTFLPPIEEYEGYIKQIWNSYQLTDQGPLLQQFEEKAKEYLEVENFHFVSNGTIALQVALKALEITEGEIITTPFSYVATTSAILWERCTPVFVDIESDTFCIDVNKIEEAITPKTKAIMAVHIYGYPCDVEQIEAIAKKYNLKVIYDGAHAFGVRYKGKPLLSYGDVSTCSFHATKPFHTIEGGCVITNSQELSDRVELIKHFGQSGDSHHMLGTNAKASEFQAAMGLCNIKYVDEVFAKRKLISELYDRLIGNRFKTPVISDKLTQRNYAYYPLVFESEAQLLVAIKKLKTENIYPRRYFYPSLNTISYVDGQSCPISEDISSRVACLPLFADMKEEIVEKIAKVINEC